MEALSHPLVSIVVVCYNSSSTIIETLESIKSQTYCNIELIVTDDKSPDNTVEVCKGWLNGNRDRFVATEIVTTQQNTGVSENLNRGVAHSNGKWIKSIAGDDLLIPNAIEEYVEFVERKTNNVKMCVCDVECFSENGQRLINLERELSSYFQYESEPYKKQYLHVLQENIFMGPTFFYTRELYDEIGGFSSEYGNGEEWPFVYKVLKTGNRIYAINQKLVKYRFSLMSLSHNANSKGLRNKALELSTCRFFFDYPLKDLIKEHHYLIAWDRFLHYSALRYYCKSDGAWWANIVMNYSKFLSPYGYWKRIRRILK